MVSNNFTKSIVANYISVVILGVSGLILNTLISIYYGAEGLGLFNIIIAIHIVISQFSTLGFHYSVLKWSAANYKYSKTLQLIFISGISVTIISSIFFSYLSYIICGFLSVIFKISDLSSAYKIVIPALFFFSLNKIILAYINGVHKMILYAILQSLRYISMVVFLIVLILFKANKLYLGLIITLSEVIVFVIGIFFFWRIFCNVFTLNYYKLFFWCKRHLHFGLKSFIAGAAIEINSRIDILILACFVNEKLIGIYSLALFAVEGLMQFVAVIRNIINPIITKYYYEKNFLNLNIIINDILKRFIVFFFFLCVGALIGFYIYINYIIFQEDFHESFNLLVIIVIGLLLSCYYLPLQFFFNQINKPGNQSIMNSAILIVNVVLNIVLIYYFNIYGAAIAISLSFISAALIIKTCYNQHLK